MIINKEELRKILPTKGPNIDEVSKYIEKYKDEIITIKYGGNVSSIGKYLITSLVTYLSCKNLVYRLLLCMEEGQESKEN